MHHSFIQNILSFNYKPGTMPEAGNISEVSQTPSLQGASSPEGKTRRELTETVCFICSGGGTGSKRKPKVPTFLAPAQSWQSILAGLFWDTVPPVLTSSAASTTLSSWECSLCLNLTYECLGHKELNWSHLNLTRMETSSSRLWF